MQADFYHSLYKYIQINIYMLNHQLTFFLDKTFVNVGAVQTPQAPTMSFTNIEIPDFLKK